MKRKPRKRQYHAQSHGLPWAEKTIYEHVESLACGCEIDCVSTEAVAFLLQSIFRASFLK